MNPSESVAVAPAAAPASPKRHNDFAWSMGIAYLLAAYYVALAVSVLGFSQGLLPAEPLAVLLAGMLIAVAVGCVGMTATVVAWFTCPDKRRLLALAFFIDAPAVVFLTYAGLRYHFAPASL